MTLEVNDINDGTILGATIREQNQEGFVRFRITLPSGRELSSEFVNPDMLRDANRAWLDHVRDQIMIDAAEPARLAKEAALKAARDAVLAGPGPLVAAVDAAEPARFADRTSPAEQARANIVTLENRRAELTQSLENLQEELFHVNEDIGLWKRLLPPPAYPD